MHFLYQCFIPSQHSYLYHSKCFATISSQLLTTSTIICNANLFITRPLILGLLLPAHKCDTIFRKVRKYLSIRTNSHPRSRESSVHKSLYSRHKNCVFIEEVNREFRTDCTDLLNLFLSIHVLLAKGCTIEGTVCTWMLDQITIFLLNLTH